MRTFMNSGANSKGECSPATIKSIVPIYEGASNHAISKENPMLSYAASGGVKFDSKEPSKPITSGMGSRMRSDAGLG